jgi:drug/metabolite transporter (DMT)-like permease
MARPARTALFLIVVVFSNLAGNLCLNWGMKRSGDLLQPAVVVGVALLIVWTLARMALLSWADLSFVLPVTAVGYVLTAAAGMALFGEQVGRERWIGALLVTAGAALVGTESRRGEA